MSRRALFAATAALAAALALYAFSGGGGRWARAERRELVFGIPFEGQLVAERNLELGPPATEQEVWDLKLSYLATDGKEVAAGEPVLVFDTTELQKQADQAAAERDQAAKSLEKRALEVEMTRRDRRLQLAEAEANARKRRLGMAVPEELRSRHQVDTARIDQSLADQEVEFRRRSLAALEKAEEVELATLREQVKVAAAKVDRYGRAIAAMRVTAPAAGTVILKSRNWTDEKYKIGDTVWRAEKVVQLPDLATLRARVDVDEALGGRLAVGQKATYFLDAHPDHRFAGRIETIGQSVQRKSPLDPTRVLKVTLTVERGEAQVALRPGMRLRGRVELERAAGALAIPEEAVLFDRQGAYVETGSWWGTQRLRPRLGRRSEGYFEVLAGLAAGARLKLPAEVAEAR